MLAQKTEPSLIAGVSNPIFKTQFKSIVVDID